MSVRLLVWPFALFGFLMDGLVEYSVGSLFSCLLVLLFVVFVYCCVYCLFDWLIA